MTSNDDQFEREAAGRYRAMLDTGDALDRLMRRASTPLSEATWHEPGDLSRISVEAMERRETLRAKGSCARCGRNPASGYAGRWTNELGERWYCHGDDDESPTCYEASDASEPWRLPW